MILYTSVEPYSTCNMAFLLHGKSKTKATKMNHEREWYELWEAIIQVDLAALPDHIKNITLL